MDRTDPNEYLQTFFYRRIAKYGKLCSALALERVPEQNKIVPCDDCPYYGIAFHVRLLVPFKNFCFSGDLLAAVKKSSGP